MSKKIYLHLLILCGILNQGIFATSGEDTRESSNFLVRKKRVITHLPSGDIPTPMNNANYIVNIKRLGVSICTGAILSHYTAITGATCFVKGESLMDYQLLSGSAYDGRSKVHEMTSKSEYHGNPPHQLIDGVALVTVDPLFAFAKNTGYIPLHVGTLPAGTLVTVSGWGNCYPLRPGPARSRRLRSITLPILNHEECENIYKRAHYTGITEKHICTYDEQQYCARSDVGAPLVFNGRLVGIHIWKGERESQRNPDVFLDLQRPEYNAWIRQNTLLM